MPEEMITIPKGKYDWLNRRAAILDFLEARGVDNWPAFAYPPDREDYETDEEYWKAYSEACDNY